MTSSFGQYLVVLEVHLVVVVEVHLVVVVVLKEMAVLMLLLHWTPPQKPLEFHQKPLRKCDQFSLHLGSVHHAAANVAALSSQSVPMRDAQSTPVLHGCFSPMLYAAGAQARLSRDIDVALFTPINR